MRIDFERSTDGHRPEGAFADFHCEVLVTNPDGSMRAFETSSDRVVEVEPKALVTQFVMAIAAQDRRRHRVRSRLLSGITWTTFAALIAVIIAVMTGFLQLRVISSGSMAGTFEIGDVVVVVGNDVIAPTPGEVIVFHYYNTGRTEIVGEFCHRIVSGSAQKGFMTQGDANTEPDLTPVLEDDVIGVVVGHIPGLGWALQPQWLIAALTIIVVIALVGPLMPRQKRGAGG